MNSLDGRLKANAAIVPAGTTGQVSVYVANTTNVLIDINAYFDSASDSSALAFFPLTPCRVVDTRHGNGGQLQAGVERDFPIPGTCGIPSNAQAYSFNITVVPPGSVAYLTVWPAGQTRPLVSTLNDGTGTIVANAAIVPAGSEGQTAVYSSNNTDLLIDVNGYYAPASSAPNPLSLYTVTPCRILDTRKTVGLFNGTLPVGIVGSLCGIPNVAQAFTLNATAVPQGGLSYLTLWPEGQTRPTVSTLNATDGAITSNMAIVPAGSGNESISAYASTNTGTQLILDVASYFAPIATLTSLTSSLPNGTNGSSYSVPLVVAGGVNPFTWTKTGGNLPPGLNLTSAGVIQGTATATGNYSFTAQAADSESPTQVIAINLQITVNGSAGTLAVTTSSLPGGTINTPYNALLNANGGITPYTWSISSGALPAGLSLNASNGLISGAPGAAGLTNLTVKITDAQNNQATQSLSISVNTGDANGTLNGSYAVVFQGFDHGNRIAAAASFTADGNGHITGGETDTSSTTGVQHTTIISGTYSIGANGLGQASWTDNTGGGSQMLIATGNAEDMRVIAFNQDGSSGVWGAGVVRQQNPSDFNLNAVAGPWVFGLQGFDASGNPLAADGTYYENSNGSFGSGSQDYNDFGNHTQVSFTGSLSAIDTNGRAISQVIVNGSTINYASYVVTANDVFLVEIDSNRPIVAAEGLRQSGTMNNGILHGNAVGRGSRIFNAGMQNAKDQAVALLIKSSGSGNISFLFDSNTGGTYTQSGQSGTYAVASNGRTVVSLPGGAEVVCYMVALNQGVCINTAAGTGNLKDAETLYFEPQAPGPFNYASVSGEYLGGSLPQYLPGDINQVDSNVVSGVANATFSSTFSQSGSGGTQENQTANGTYSVDATSGEVIISVSGNPIYHGFIISGTKLALVSATAPLVSIESTSAAPRHP